MSEHHQKVPALETTDVPVDATVGLEKDTLDKQAKSATYRDAFERAQHLTSLYKRIEVLQNKLNDCEVQNNKLLPRNAELEQSSRISKVLVRDGTILLTVGGGAISMSSLCVEGGTRYGIAAFGMGVIICGLWICKVLNRNAWPPERE